MPPWNRGPSACAGRGGPSNVLSAANASGGSEGRRMSCSAGARARYDQRPRSPTPSEIRQSVNGSSAKAPATSMGSRQGARRMVGGDTLPMQARVLLLHPCTDGVDGIAGQHAAARQEAPVLPVGEAELGPVQRVLAVHPAGHAIADEAGVGVRPDEFVRLQRYGDHREDELRAVEVE